MSPRPNHIALLTLSGLVIAAVALTAGATLLAPVRPTALGTALPTTDVPVSTQPFADERSVEVALDFSTTFDITSGESGRITRIECQVGGMLHSGTSPLSINGDARVALATAIPPWRALADGDTGPDVEALQAELARLGFDVTIDAHYGSQTLAAFNALLDAVGSARVRDFDLGKVLWIPAAEVPVSACPLAAGADVESGAAIASVPGGLGGVTVRMPADALPGDRQLVLAGVTAPVGADGLVTDPAVLTELVQQGLRPSADSPDGGTETTAGTLELRTPVDIVVVPPSSVVIDGDLACVYAAERMLPVTIVGSQLGQTYVVMSADPPESVLVHPTATTCG